MPSRESAFLLSFLLISTISFAGCQRSPNYKTAGIQTAQAPPAKTGAEAVSVKREGEVGKPPSKEAIARGKKVFERATCAGCHPNGGNSLHPSRPLKGPLFLSRYKDDAEIVKVVRKGVPNTGMPSFDTSQINDSDMLDLVAYIKSLSASAVK